MVGGGGWMGDFTAQIGWSLRELNLSMIDDQNA